MTYAEMIETVQGYRAHFNQIDSEVAHERGCQKCNSKNIHYRGFKQEHGESYRAFIECNDCGECAEF